MGSPQQSSLPLPESPYKVSEYKLPDGRFVKRFVSEPDTAGRYNVRFSLRDGTSYEPPANYDFTPQGIVDLKVNKVVGPITSAPTIVNPATQAAQPGATIDLPPVNNGASPYKVTSYKLSDGTEINRYRTAPDTTGHFQERFVKADGTPYDPPKNLDFTDQGVVDLRSNNLVGNVTNSSAATGSQTFVKQAPAPTGNVTSNLPTMDGKSPYTATKYTLSDGTKVTKLTTEPDATGHYQQRFLNEDGTPYDPPKNLDFTDKGVVDLQRNTLVGKVDKLNATGTSPASANGFNNLKDSPYLRVNENGKGATFTNPTTGKSTYYNSPEAAQRAVDKYVAAQQFGDYQLTSLTSKSAPMMVGDTNVGVRVTDNGLYQVGRVDSKGNFKVISDKSDMMYDPEYAAAEAMKAADSNGGGSGGAPGANLDPGAKAKPVVSTGEKFMAFAGLGMLAYSSFQMFSSGRADAGSIISLGLGSLSGVFQLSRTLASYGLTNPLFAPGLMAGAVVLGLLLSRLAPKKDNDGAFDGINNTSSPRQPIEETTGVGPQSWDSWLPEGSRFYILGTVATIAIAGAGQLNLDPSSKIFVPDARIQLKSSDMDKTLTELKKDTGRTSLPSNLLGKVFIKKGGTQNPDVAVFLTANGNGDGGYTLNKVSMNRVGDLVSGATPSDTLLPFWLVEPQTGTISPNPPAFEAVTTQVALAEAANGGVSPENARNAAGKASLAPHGF